jgi:hypothetical protein
LSLGATGIFLEIFAPGYSSPLGTLGEYLQLLLLLAAVLLAVIGCRRNIRNNFFKSLFHGYLILLMFLASASVVLAVVHGGDLNGLFFLHLVIQYLLLSVLIFLLPISIVLFFIRKLKSKKHRRIGYAAAITVFAALYHIGHYFVLQEIGDAIGAAAVMGV